MNQRVARYILGVDALWLMLALGLSCLLRYGRLQPYPPADYRFLILAGVGIWSLLFATMRLDCLEGGWRLHVVIGRTVTAAGLLIVCVLTFAYLQKLYYSRLLLGYFAALMLIGVILIRVGAYFFLRAQHRRGRARKVVLVGSERFTREFAFKILKHPELLYQVVGTLSPVGTGVSSRDSAVAPSERTLNSFDVLRALRNRGVDELIVLLEESPGIEFQTFVVRCIAGGVHVSVLPRGYELYTSKARLIEIDGLPLISLEGPKTFPGAPAVKRSMDLLIGIALVPPAACILAIGAVVLLLHKRRVLRREVRIGKDGHAFAMYRFDIDRQADDRPVYERILRDLSISEIPQLWHVLRGEMSLVGPRPESPERVKHYSEWQKQRLKAKPGMTGLAQVNGLREQHASEDKTRFDLQYLLEWSPLMDLLLLLQTICTLAKRCVSSPDPGSEEFHNSDNQGLFLTGRRSQREVAHADRA
jgi:lipopolysaccharide/colanic/teichoic acid biosynthesis glycosyltransferase